MTVAFNRFMGALLTCAIALTMTVGICPSAHAAEKVDQSLYVPSIYSYKCDQWSTDAPYATLGLLCPGNEFGTAYTGFQAYVSLSPDFSDPREISSHSEWNNHGYAYLTLMGSWAYENLRGGETYYVKVRSYKNAGEDPYPGDSSTYGPWSAVTTIDVPYYPNHLAQNSKYTYELYALSDANTTIYSGCTVPIYVKTNNPDPNSFDFVTDAEMWRIGSASSMYPDIDFKDEYILDSAEMIRVDGGYIWVFNTDDLGTFEFEVREYQKDGYVIADKFNLTIGDYAQARDVWMDSIIAQVTTSNMDKFEKMRAVSDYLLSRFKYLTNDGNGHLLTLAAQPNSPYFLTYHWDSYISPAALCQFAERIGGFTKIDNLYGNYADYGYSWANGHYLCYCSDGDREAFYQACPMSSTGAVSYSTIDLSNPRNLYSINGIQKLAFENPKPSEPVDPTPDPAPTPTPGTDSDPTPTPNPTPTPTPDPDPEQPTTPTTPGIIDGEDDDIQTQDMHRLYNPNSGEHFYTADENERDFLVSVGWNYEGVEWTAPVSSDTPVYRLYSGTDHHYCTGDGERDALIAAGWSYEGVGWYSDDNMGVPLWRQFNPYVDPTAPINNSGSHNYTTSYDEHEFLVSIGWIGEDVGWYGVL